MESLEYVGCHQPLDSGRRGQLEEVGRGEMKHSVLSKATQGESALIWMDCEDILQGEHLD